jgi:hypothetical protein
MYQIAKHIPNGREIDQHFPFFRGKELPRVASFILLKLTEAGKIYQITIQYTKKPQNIARWPSNIPTSFIARPSKIYPDCEFWSENKPSGNPDG